MGKQLHETPPPPRVRAPTRPIPRALEAAVLKAMAKSPADRFESAAAMRAALEAVRDAPVRRRERAKRAASAVLMGAALVGAAVGSAWWVRERVPALASSISAPAASAALPAVMAAVPLGEAPTGGALARPASGPSVRVQSPVSVPTLREARARAHGHPTSAAALDAWTRAALAAGELREAHRAASAWASRDTSVEPRLVMAEVLDASGRRPEAAALLTEWLQSHPDAEDARAALTRLSGDAVAGR